MMEDFATKYSPTKAKASPSQGHSVSLFNPYLSKDMDWIKFASNSGILVLKYSKFTMKGTTRREMEAESH